MFSSMWFMSILALLVVDVRTGALQQQEINPLRCHHCLPANGTKTCGRPSEWSPVACPVNRPYCATSADASDFKSSLTCSGATKRPCSLKISSRRSLQLTCVCMDHLCNIPFSEKLRNRLTSFPSKDNSSENLTDTLLSIFANFSDTSLYEDISASVTDSTKIPIINSSQLTTRTVPIITADDRSSSRHSGLIPRAEALKQEATVPSDDDEDESEGSGSYEEARSHSHPASAPAAPSSYLPANENKASVILTNFLITTPLFLHVII